MVFQIKKSGKKWTVKRDAPKSPANVRQVDDGNMYNPAHTHAKVPDSLRRKEQASQRTTT